MRCPYLTFLAQPTHFVPMSACTKVFWAKIKRVLKARKGKKMIKVLGN
jgi:hypothetical protein